MARPRIREDPLVRRTQIIDEAIRIIGDRGYNGFTVQALAERCKLSNAGLLYYFESKDQLLLALLDELERRETEIIAPLVAAAKMAKGPASHATIIEVLRMIVVRAADQPELSRFTGVLQSEALDATHPAHDWFRLREAATLKLFARLASVVADEPLRRARQLLALMTGLMQQWMRSDKGFDLVAEWEKAICAILPLSPKKKVAKRKQKS